MTTISAREFNQDVSAAKRAAKKGPVIITDRHEPAFTLLTYEDYCVLVGDERSIVDRLSMDDDFDVDFPPVELDLKTPEL